MSKEPTPGCEHAPITEQDGILTVTFTREAKLNAITPEMTAALWEALNLLSLRDDLRCLVITGTGKYFTAGMDLGTQVGSSPGNPETEAQHPGWNFRRNYRSHHLLYDEIEAIEKPVIIAAQGISLGAGVEMAVSCDFRFASTNAAFGLPEVNIGVMAGSGGTSRLTRIVGPAWAKYIAMAGMRVSAERALQIGLVHDVFPAETFLDDVYAFCRRLIAISPDVLGVTKLAIDMYADVDRTTQRHIDRIAVHGLVQSGEFDKARERFSKD
ncbi:MAG TPA: enoyl-CoA hydratase/isomerase family protein [Mycobacteriales bacterium]|nr:enoyl-CoA hydratase/isomerase family protein [Mycobacteriales bacterium]